MVRQIVNILFDDQQCKHFIYVSKYIFSDDGLIFANCNFLLEILIEITKHNAKYFVFNLFSFLLSFTKIFQGNFLFVYDSSFRRG